MKGCRPLSPAEVNTVLASFGDDDLSIRNHALFVLGLNTGLRVSELTTLQLRDVYANGEVQSSLQVKRRHVKGQTEGRILRVNKKAKAALGAWISVLNTWNPEPKTPLFCSRRLRAISRVQVWNILNRIFSSIGMAGVLGTHCMRKTFADRMYELLGRDLKQLQGALGHKWITSTSQYLSFKEDEINDAIDAL